MIKNKIYNILPKRIKQLIQAININPEEYFFLPKKKLSYAQDLLYTFNNADFLKEKKFIESYNLGKQTDGGQLLKNYDIQWRIHVLCWAAYHAKHLKGDFVDCGVNTGIFARAVINYIDFNKLDKKYYLLDTFSGMDPKYSSSYEMARSKKLEYENEGEIYESVLKTFSKFNTKIIKGSIPDTLSRVDTKNVCYLSVDMNSIYPEIEALKYFWDKMVSGGIIILDDYGYPGSETQKEAHDNFAKSKGVKILSLPTCQGLLIKP